MNRTRLLLIGFVALALGAIVSYSGLSHSADAKPGVTPRPASRWW